MTRYQRFVLQRRLLKLRGRSPWKWYFEVLKAMLRDWLFADYKWVTRAQVQREICALRSEHRDHPLVQRVLQDLQETIK